MDFKASYDSIIQGKLSMAIEESKIPTKLIKLTKAIQK
jgi:hypothetical protein